MTRRVLNDTLRENKTGVTFVGHARFVFLHRVFSPKGEKIRQNTVNYILYF